MSEVAVAVHCVTDWGKVYLVRGPECTCPDFMNRGGPCKQLAAVGLLSRATAERNHRQRALHFGERSELSEAGTAALAALADAGQEG